MAALVHAGTNPARSAPYRPGAPDPQAAASTTVARSTAARFTGISVFLPVCDDEPGEILAARFEDQAVARDPS